MWIAFGALTAAAAVAAGAFGAHGLEGRLDERAMQLWETAARYLMYGGLGTMLSALILSEQLRQHALGARVALWSLTGGAWIFAGTVALLALGGPRWLGAVTPLGGLLLIVGFAAIAFCSN